MDKNLKIQVIEIDESKFNKAELDPFVLESQNQFLKAMLY